MARERLRTTVRVGGDVFFLYNAGLAGEKVKFGIFPRDLLVTGLMLEEVELLRETIRFSLATIGRQQDPTTGEEPGRVLHELQDVRRDGLSSRYSAVETSQLLLIAAKRCLALSGEISPFAGREGLRAAGEYVLRHVRDGLFWEDPAFCGGKAYFAKATYWKDSHLPGRGEPRYPVAYTLVQAQTAAALRALARLSRPLGLGFSARALEGKAAGIVRSIWTVLWDEELGFPMIALDEGGPIQGISSDALHLLAYLRPGEVPPEKLEAIRAGARRLFTPYGVRTYAPGQPDFSPFAYHLGAIWPYEQYFIALGAQMHGLGQAVENALRVALALQRLGFVELFYWTEEGLVGPGAVPGEGCGLQLWSAAVPEGFLRLAGAPCPMGGVGIAYPGREGTWR
ncbi:hypothetical protein H5T52_07285 [Candidatus Bipolaricaulota bacterium]|nr:hypothetical protein [Candidatus Bipolaricaulota bacterium]